MLRRVSLLALAVFVVGCGGAEAAPTTPTSSPLPPPPPTVAVVNVSPTTGSLVPGESQLLAAVARDAAGTAIAGATFTWSSSSVSVATVASDGRATALTPGTTTISATSGAVSATALLTVNEGGLIAVSGGTVTALNGQLRLEIPAGALTAPTAFVVRPVAAPTPNARLLAGTAVAITPAITFATPATVRLRYPTALAADVVETQLRIGRLTDTTWQTFAVVAPDRVNRTAAARVTGTGTLAVFAPPPSLRGYAQRRSFDIGAAVSVDALRADSTYRRVLAEEFNSVTLENAMKFGPIHPAATTYAFANADTIVGFAVANNMKVYGHVLLWHTQQPAWLTDGTPTRAFLLSSLKSHIETVVARYAGKTTSWDVANEMIADNGTGLRRSFWIEVAGADIIDSAFVWARRSDPNARLFLSDYSVETVNRKSDSLFALATRLKAAGVPIDGVGLQGHFALPTPSAAQLTANLARFAAAGLDIRYTEIDVRLADGTDNLAVQGSAYGTIIDACLAQPRCKSLTTWGFTDKYSWIQGTFSGFGRGLPFDQLFGPKPAYLTLRDALARP